jgi:hypothetical protein
MGEADSCVPIVGATSPFFGRVGAADLSTRLAVEVTATNAFGPTTVLSPLSEYVAAPTAELSRHPRKKTANTHAEFSFESNAIAFKDATGVGFKCKLDQKPFRWCESPFKADLKPGSHVFLVRAVGPESVRDKVGEEFRWRILRR